MKKETIVYLTQAAMIAAIYVALTLVFAPFSYGQIQVRISEALTILPVFSSAAIPGLFLGCLLANFLGGAAIPDIIFGTLATLIGAWGTYMLRNTKPALFPLPPILSNAFIIPFVLRYAYAVALPIPFMMLTVGIGEVIACGLLGLGLYYLIKKQRISIFS